MNYTQTADEASKKTIRFANREDCVAYIAKHELLAIPHNQIGHYIAICLMRGQTWGVSSPTTCELFPDW